MNLFLGRESQKQGTIDDSRERKPKNVQNEDYLLRQIDEFRDKAKQLQALLGSKEQKVRELEALVNEREDKAEELELLLKARREEADRLIRGVAVQLQKMIDILDQKMDQLNENVQQQVGRVDMEINGNMQQFHAQVEEKFQVFDTKVDGAVSDLNTKVEDTLSGLNEKVNGTMSGLDERVVGSLDSLDEKIQEHMTDIDQRISAQIREIDERVNGQLEENLARAKEQELAMTASLEGLKEAMDRLGSDLSEKVHTESVKCYRNTKGLIDEQNEQFAQVELSEDSVKKVNKSFLGLKFLAVFALVDCALLVVFLLYQFGILG